MKKNFNREDFCLHWQWTGNLSFQLLKKAFLFFVINSFFTLCLAQPESKKLDAPIEFESALFLQLEQLKSYQKKAKNISFTTDLFSNNSFNTHSERKIKFCENFWAKLKANEKIEIPKPIEFAHTNLEKQKLAKFLYDIANINKILYENKNGIDSDSYREFLFEIAGFYKMQDFFDVNQDFLISYWKSKATQELFNENLFNSNLQSIGIPENLKIGYFVYENKFRLKNFRELIFVTAAIDTSKKSVSFSSHNLNAMGVLHENEGLFLDKTTFEKMKSKDIDQDSWHKYPKYYSNLLNGLVSEDGIVFSWSLGTKDQLSRIMVVNKPKHYFFTMAAPDDLLSGNNKNYCYIQFD